MQLPLPFPAGPAGSVPMVRLALVREPGAPYVGPQILTAADAAAILAPHLAECSREVVLALLLDARHRPVGLHVVSMGSVTASMLSPAEVLKAVLLANASAVIVAHNHPSGDPEPSAEDVASTKKLHEAGRIVGIDVLDHLVVGAGRWVSLKERGHSCAKRI